MKRTFPRCTCVTRDGSQCGRRVTDGSNPPVCHIHRAAAAGGSVSPLTTRAMGTDDIPRILLKMFSDPDATVRLRAIDAWQKFEERQAARGKRESPWHDLIAAMTEDERDHVRGCLETIATIKDTVFERNPRLMPDDLTLERRRRRDAEEHRRALDQQPPSVPVPTVEVTSDTAPTPVQTHVAPPRTELTADLWEDVGLFELNGVVTHRLGDEHAQQILTGEISYEDARAAHEAARAQAQRIAASID